MKIAGKNPGIWNIFLLLSEPDLWEPRSLPVLMQQEW